MGDDLEEDRRKTYGASLPRGRSEYPEKNPRILVLAEYCNLDWNSAHLLPQRWEALRTFYLVVLSLYLKTKESNSECKNIDKYWYLTLNRKLSSEEIR